MGKASRAKKERREHARDGFAKDGPWWGMGEELEGGWEHFKLAVVVVRFKGGRGCGFTAFGKGLGIVDPPGGYERLWVTIWGDEARPLTGELEDFWGRWHRVKGLEGMEFEGVEGTEVQFGKEGRGKMRARLAPGSAAKWSLEGAVAEEREAERRAREEKQLALDRERALAWRVREKRGAQPYAKCELAEDEKFTKALEKVHKEAGMEQRRKMNEPPLFEGKTREEAEAWVAGKERPERYLILPLVSMDEVVTSGRQFDPLEEQEMLRDSLMDLKDLLRNTAAGVERRIRGVQ